jgi:hypothetical protein
MTNVIILTMQSSTFLSYVVTYHFHLLMVCIKMTKITISTKSHKSYRKYKSENGRTRASEYIRGGIRCQGGVSIPC